MTRFFVAIIEQSGDGYYAFFPDVPGCTSAGTTVQEAVRNAEEALREHLLLALENNEPIPAPSSLDAIEADPETQEAARILVRFDEPIRSVRVNILLPEDLLAELDRFAKDHGFTRSGFLAQAVRERIKAE